LTGAPAAAMRASNNVDLPLPYGPTRAIERGPAAEGFEEDPVMMASPFLHFGRQLMRSWRGQNCVAASADAAEIDAMPIFYVEIGPLLIAHCSTAVEAKNIALGVRLLRL